MKLQLAIDLTDLDAALALLAQVNDLVDIIEAGTPLVKKEGVRAVVGIKQAYPHLQVLADFKIIDAGELEARMAFEAGADLVTVLALASDATIQGVVKQAHRQGKQVVVDLIELHDHARRARQIDNLGADYICVHTALDMQKRGKTPLTDLEQVSRLSLQTARLTVAGGINPKTLPQILAYRPAVVVVGNFITANPHPRDAALEIRHIMRAAEPRNFVGKLTDAVGGWFKSSH